MAKEQYTALIADDHRIVRDALRMALQTPGVIEPEGLRVVAEAEDGLATIAAAKLHRPDLITLDIEMPRAGGVEVLVEIRRWCPETRVIVFTGVKAPGILCNIIAAGADGLFSKGSSSEVLYERIPHILRGGRYIDQPFLQILEGAPDRSDLTSRERQTLNMIVRGKSNREIAEDLSISIKTVEKHRTSLMQKLGVSSITQLMALAVKEGLIDPAREL